MPVINLGPFGRFEIARKTTPAEPLLPIHKCSSNVDMNDKPPPYTALPTASLAITNSLESRPHHCDDSTNQETADEVEWISPAAVKMPECRVRQLRRYLIEIVALTLDADFDKLNAALYKDKDAAGTSSILSDGERAELFGLAQLTIKAHDLHKQSLPIPETDQRLLRSAIIEPGKDLSIGLIESDSLDYIAWYGQPLTRPIPWAETLPGYWRTKHNTRPFLLGPYDDEPDQSMKGIFRLIPLIAMTKEVCTVLDQAFDNCCEKEGYNMRDCKYRDAPKRLGYHKLYLDVLYHKEDMYKPAICGERYTSDCMCGKEVPLGRVAVMTEEQFQAKLVEIATAGDAFEVIKRASSLLIQLSSR
jgi:hypothetical protein